MTPREIVKRIEGASRRLRREHNERAWLAWTTAALGRSKRMPSLEKLISGERRATPRRQTWQEQLSIMHALTNRKKRA